MDGFDTMNVELQIGALSWVQHNMLVARRAGMAFRTFAAPTEVKMLMDQFEVTEAKLKGMGREAMARGVNQHRDSVRSFGDPGATGQLRYFFKRAVDYDGMEGVDGTMPLDSPARYWQGPNWRDNSCAVDTAVMVAVLCDLGRTKRDQTRNYGMYSESALVLRRSVAPRWGTLSQPNKEKARDRVWKAVVKALGETQGALLSQQGVMDACYHGFPTMTFTIGRVWRCCGHSWTMSGPDRDTWNEGAWQNTTRLQLSGMPRNVTFQQRVQSLLDWKSSGRTRCPDDGCTGSSRHNLHCVLDRLPAILQIVPAPGEKIDRGDSETFQQLSAGMELIAWDSGERATRYRYRFVGMVLGDNVHFRAAWLLREEDTHDVWEYDGMQRKGRLTKVPGWGSLFDESKAACVTMCFFERIGMEEQG